MRKRYLNTLIAGAAIGILMGLFYLFGFFQSWSAKLNDALFLQGEASSDIVIVAIDNESIVKIGRWPWDRAAHARLLEKLIALEPTVIGYDVNFSEKADPEGDARFTEEIKRAGNVVLPIEADVSFQNDAIIASNLLSSENSFRDAAQALGLTNTPPDGDGVFRKMPIAIVDENGREISSFSEIIASQYLSSRQRTMPEIPLANGRMIVNFAGEPKTIAQIPAIDVIEGRITADQIKNKIVLIGATAPDLHDEIMVPTSRGTMMSGVEVHANAVNTIITGNFLRHFGTFPFLLILLFVSAVICLLVSLLKFRWGAVITLAVIILYILTAVFVFDRGIILNIFYFVFGAALAYLTAVIIKYLAEEKEKRFIKSTFSQYVSPEIIEDIMANPKKLKLGGEKKELTVMFSDIRGFTSMSEKLKPEELVQLLNEYLSAMTDIVLDCGGVVDKFIGDAVMAFWGAPLDRPDHAGKACGCALGMIEALTKNKEVWKSKYGVELNIGIGINTGELIIGNLGSDKRFDYTVIGDSVNLASRLEGLTKMYGVGIIVSEFTKSLAGDDFVFRQLDKVAVKGKSLPVGIYELMAEKTKASQEINALAKNFDEGIGLYQAGDWDRAINVFSDILRRFPEDQPSRLMLERSRELLADPPAVWDGAYYAKTK